MPCYSINFATRGCFVSLLYFIPEDILIGGIFYLHDGEVGKTMACYMGTQSADHSTFSKAYIEQWVRVPEHQDSLAVLRGFSGTNLSPLNGLSGTPADEAFYLWDDYSGVWIVQAATADAWSLHTATSPTVACGSSSESTSWKCSRSSWQSPSGVDNLHVHDTRRTPRGHSEQVQASLNMSSHNDIVGGCLHTQWFLFPYTLANPATATARRATTTTPRLCGGNGASSSTASSTVLQVGPTDHRLVLRQHRGHLLEL